VAGIATKPAGLDRRLLTGSEGVGGYCAAGVASWSPAGIGLRGESGRKQARYRPTTIATIRKRAYLSGPCWIPDQPMLPNSWWLKQELCRVDSESFAALVDSVLHLQLTRIEKKLQLELRQFVVRAWNVAWVKDVDLRRRRQRPRQRHGYRASG
jgi:hypothetical protein